MAFVAGAAYSGGSIEYFEKGVAVRSLAPGIPSAGTIAAFLAIVFAVGFRAIFETRLWVGIFCSAVGFVAILGYLTGVESLYYYWEGLSTGMAAPTAILFVMLGVSLITAYASKTEQPSPE